MCRHELKTPVGAVSLLTEAIEQASDDPEAIEYFVGRLHKGDAPPVCAGA